MKRLFAAIAAVMLSGLLATGAQAGWQPDLGCHRVGYTPPGWGQPISVELCP